MHMHMAPRASCSLLPPPSFPSFRYSSFGVRSIIFLLCVLPMDLFLLALSPSKKSSPEAFAAPCRDTTQASASD